MIVTGAEHAPGLAQLTGLCGGAAAEVGFDGATVQLARARAVAEMRRGGAAGSKGVEEDGAVCESSRSAVGSPAATEGSTDAARAARARVLVEGVNGYGSLASEQCIRPTHPPHASKKSPPEPTSTILYVLL